MSGYPKIVYLNGHILPGKEAVISVFDRGFLFGDGVYEVLVQFDSKRFYEQEHLGRLSASLKKIRITLDIASLPSVMDNLLEASELTSKDCLIYIQITRGVAPRKHHFPTDVSPTILLYAVPITLPDINKTLYKIQLQEDIRWHRCDIKTISLSGSVLANDDAITNGYHEAVFYRDGYITEGSHSNIFFVKEGTVFTHPANNLILEGITRNIVIDLCKKLDIPVEEKAIHRNDIASMDEVFLTGTTTQIAGVAEIGNHTFRTNEVPGSVTLRLQEAFMKAKKN